jgi:Skp family chaperone for outer membrane proteins
MTRLTIAVVVTVCLAAGPAAAQIPLPAPTPQEAPAPPALFPADARIAFVDLQNVFAQSDFGDRARTQLAELQQALDLDLESRLEERDGLSRQIQSQQDIVTDAILAGMVANLRRLEREAQFARQEAQIQAEDLQGALIEEFRAQVIPVIEAIRVERNLLAVFSVPPAEDPGSGLQLIAADRSLNLSGEVVRRLNGAQ